MARIRTIKPEFFTSEDIVSLTPLSRLFYQSLWCEADREGRLEWKPRTFKLRYFPGDNCDIEAMADELIESGLVVIYRVDGRTYAEIPTFTRHQVINNRESASEIPRRVESEIDASSTRESGVQAEGKEGRERKGKEGKGKEGNDGVPPDAARPQSPIPKSATERKPGKSKRPPETPLPDGFEISDAVRSWAEKNGHAPDLQAHFDNFVGAALAKGYTYVNWDQALMNAIRNNWAKVGERQPGNVRPLPNKSFAQQRTEAEIDAFVNGPSGFDGTVIEVEARRVGF